MAGRGTPNALVLADRADLDKTEPLIERPAGWRRQQHDRARGGVGQQPLHQPAADAEALAVGRHHDQTQPSGGLAERPPQADPERPAVAAARQATMAELDQGGDIGPPVRPTDRRHERRDGIQVRHRHWRQGNLIAHLHLTEKAVRGSICPVTGADLIAGPP
jgi:hypothetical protein